MTDESVELGRRPDAEIKTETYTEAGLEADRKRVKVIKRRYVGVHSLGTGEPQWCPRDEVLADLPAGEVYPVLQALADHYPDTELVLND
jgi:hypothetical protein